MKQLKFQITMHMDVDMTLSLSHFLQVLMLMVLAKLEELKIPFDVAAVISDFELNILSSQLMRYMMLMWKDASSISPAAFTLVQGTVVQGYFSQRDSYPRIL